MHIPWVNVFISFPAKQHMNEWMNESSRSATHCLFCALPRKLQKAQPNKLIYGAWVSDSTMRRIYT